MITQMESLPYEVINIVLSSVRLSDMIRFGQVSRHCRKAVEWSSRWRADEIIEHLKRKRYSPARSGLSTSGGLGRIEEVFEHFDRVSKLLFQREYFYKRIPIGPSGMTVGKESSISSDETPDNFAISNGSHCPPYVAMLMSAWLPNGTN